MLDVNASSLCAFERTLTRNERERWRRLAFGRVREHFIVARGIPQSAVGVYLGLAAEEVRFAYGPRGKPELWAQGEGAPLRFNVTHSSGLALFAFARGRALGVDIDPVFVAALAIEVGGHPRRHRAVGRATAVDPQLVLLAGHPLSERSR